MQSPSYLFGFRNLPDGRRVLLVSDQRGAGVPSLTNGIEIALREIERLVLETLPGLILYQDSQGFWDQVVWKNRQVVFWTIGQPELDSALRALMTRGSPDVKY